ncbi:MAG: TetR/AcrR family transcriptional regulator [Firmicutes bacterium]|nr:TetR/AcrR family transcriptional regulator [Bacillota bacterium]
MKRRTAQEILADSFREIAAVKSINKITIQEIVDNCGYSPATFYRNFKDKYDLIAWEHTRDVAEIMDRTGKQDDPWKQTLLDGARRFDAEKAYLANLFQHTSGHDSFVRYMVDINQNALKNHILSVCGKSDLDKKEELYLRIYCLGTVNLTCEWILGRFDASPEEIAEVYERSLPEPLQKYLF